MVKRIVLMGLAASLVTACGSGWAPGGGDGDGGVIVDGDSTGSGRVRAPEDGRAGRPDAFGGLSGSYQDGDDNNNDDPPKTGGGGSTGTGGGTTTGGTCSIPSGACISCIQEMCSSEYAACLDDAACCDMAQCVAKEGFSQGCQSTVSGSAGTAAATCAVNNCASDCAPTAN